MSNIRILILEDSPTQSASLATMLRYAGYQSVDIANSGERAIKMFRELHPDLVMLDIMMPGSINGVEAGKAMMEMRRTPHIYLSAWLDDFFDEAAVTQPSAVFSKPFNERDLQRAIELAIRLHAQDIEPELADAPERVVFPGVIISRDCLWLKQHSEARERFCKLPAAELEWVKSDNVYLEFHLANRSLPIVIGMKISAFAEAIKGREGYKHLLRVGISYIVNLRCVASFTKTFDEITMQDGTKIHISDTYREAVRQALTLH